MSYFCILHYLILFIKLPRQIIGKRLKIIKRSQSHVFSQSDNQFFDNLNRPIQHAAESKLWNDKCDYMDLTKSKNLNPLNHNLICAANKHKGNAYKTFWIKCTLREMQETKLSNWYSQTMWNLPHTRQRKLHMHSRVQSNY